jgi:AraC family transcriptional regulator, regulatory protein of adaptative response / methylated-DNA-[protein]-cysteine methyltransferase
MRTLTEREMRRAFFAADGTYDGIFVTGVRTTGIFCRPSCAARKPKPDNVEFYPSARDALFAGFRPCKRCRPLETSGKPPAWVARLLARLDRAPGERLPAAQLRKLGVDPARVRRYFLKVYGMTFQAYCRALRLHGAFRRIKQGEKVQSVALQSGYESESAFRSAFEKQFGIAPASSVSMDAVSLAWVETPVGPMLAGATSTAICLLEFTDRRMLETQLAILRRRFGTALVPGENALIDRLKAQLQEYFAAGRRYFELPLAYPGTPFQVRVWSQLLAIPYGETCSYRELAERIGNAGAVRAVGQANGMNRIAIVIPCHRVVNSGGGLGGYGGGLWRKQRLLDLERGQNALQLPPAAAGSSLEPQLAALFERDGAEHSFG